jgi:hypothetical protein
LPAAGEASLRTANKNAAANISTRLKAAIVDLIQSLLVNKNNFAPAPFIIERQDVREKSYIAGFMMLKRDMRLNKFMEKGQDFSRE